MTQIAFDADHQDFAQAAQSHARGTDRSTGIVILILCLMSAAFYASLFWGLEQLIQWVSGW